jgi:hypothetical protein
MPCIFHIEVATFAHVEALICPSGPRPNPKWEDPAESERLVEATKAEVSDDPKAFERALKRVPHIKASSHYVRTLTSA